MSVKHFAGPDTSIEELTNFICAAQMAKAADAHLGVDHDLKVAPLFFRRMLSILKNA